MTRESETQRQRKRRKWVSSQHYLISNSTEPWLCWASGAARKPQDQLPYGGHDGAGPTDHHPCETGRLRLYRQHRASQKVLHSLQTVWGTADQTGTGLLVGPTQAMLGTELVLIIVSIGPVASSRQEQDWPGPQCSWTLLFSNQAGHRTILGHSADGLLASSQARSRTGLAHGAIGPLAWSHAGCVS